MAMKTTMAMPNAKCLTINSLNQLSSSKSNLPTKQAPPLLPLHGLHKAQQITDLAAKGNKRGLTLLLPIVPAILWVLYNILQPALNQLNRMSSQKAIIVGLSLGAYSLFPTPSASANNDIAQIADASSSDSRGLLLLFVIAPVVLYGCFTTFFNQR